jgi:hypothetical protein
VNDANRAMCLRVRLKQVRIKQALFLRKLFGQMPKWSFGGTSRQEIERLRRMRNGPAHRQWYRTGGDLGSASRAYHGQYEGGSCNG